ncbi:hypothetical protein GCL60_06820 [Silvanigrella paludirubra]|uniref:Uncharacterized protein n=1 Tax=Silvanigrella paludirubra TaxID=2499159 RepID=A0A6N6VW27_9BACT|nr:hypothetical protein [Silvanigrella paludirubra]KAB8039969.1 hypothetical protein GCL60_06820 [Silvanigrella paludirubra]
MLTSTEFKVNLYCIGFILPLLIISLFLIRFKIINNIEKRYNIKLGKPLFIPAQFAALAKCFNVADYITYLYLIKIGLLKFRERIYNKPLLYEINYTLKDESKFNIMVCILFSITHRINIAAFIFLAYITGTIQEAYLLFIKSLYFTNFILLYISLSFLLIYLIITPIIKIKILKKLESEYNIIIKNSFNFIYNRYFYVSNHIKDLYLSEKNIFKLKKGNYILKSELTEIQYSIKNESKFNIYICIIHSYSVRLFAIFIFIFIFAISVTLDIAYIFGDK